MRIMFLTILSLIGFDLSLIEHYLRNMPTEISVKVYIFSVHGSRFTLTHSGNCN